MGKTFYVELLSLNCDIYIIKALWPMFFFKCFRIPWASPFIEKVSAFKKGWLCSAGLFA